VGFCRFLGVRINDLAAHVAQLAEHVLGKDEVISSILIMGSSLEKLKLKKRKTNQEIE
jgi:hypothetical protein